MSKKEKKIRKLIDVSEDCEETITIEGAKKRPKKKFKAMAEEILENHAKKIKK